MAPSFIDNPMQGVGGLLGDKPQQVYWSHADDILEKYRAEQLEFLEKEINSIPSDAKRLVLLTHIPPFMESFDEQDRPSGWANWRKDFRKEILDVLAKAKLPMLFICGLPVDIRVTSSAGTTIQWDGKDTLSPHEAQQVASKPVMDAFRENVGFDKITKRLRAEPSRSGLRVFTFETDTGSFEDQWYTLEDLTSGSARS
eukprot:Skav215931  [mRNA]  locus=scaffold226:333317:336012:+ [translate_table: standard]